MKRVALLACEPPGEPPGFWTSYAVRRVMAELTHEVTPDLDVRLFDIAVGNIGEAAQAVLAFSPDLVGCSAYVWSFPHLLHIARELRLHRPEATVVFGGPSARAAMFRLERYRPFEVAVDALVVGEGEGVFRQIAALDRQDASSLSLVPGVAVRTSGGWSTPGLGPGADLDALASPYEAGLIPRSEVAMLETFRGCPLGCLFCQWGGSTGRSPAFSASAIARDLRCIAALAPREVQLIDAAINLNAAAFRNLVAAHQEERVFERIPLSFEVYPSRISDEQLRFLEPIRLGTIGVGVQSYDREVLRHLNRRHDEQRVEHVVRMLAALGGQVCVELIFGLPGDSPSTFRRTLDRVLQLPCDVRVFHCLALPDALMTRAPPGADISFDPETLRVTSCAGWSSSDIGRLISHLDASAQSRPNTPFSTWTFERPRKARTRIDRELINSGAETIAVETHGMWQVVDVEPKSGWLLVTLSVFGKVVVIEVRPHDGSIRSYIRVGNLDLSYRGSPSKEVLEALTSDASCLAPTLCRWVEVLAGGLPRALGA